MGFETSGFSNGVTNAQLSVAGNPLPDEQDPMKDREANAAARTVTSSPRYTPV